MFLLIKFYFREERHSILGYNIADYAEAIQVENVCEDIENNNTRDKDNNFDNNPDAIPEHHSSNSKGIFAQVRIRKLVNLKEILK